MKNNKGFTLIEVLSVLIILGVLVSLVAGSVSMYRARVNEKEVITLKSTISSGYDGYRQKQLMSGETVELKKYFCEGNNMFLNISYAGKKLTCDDIKSDSFVELKIKGELLDIPKYTNGRSEEAIVSDGTCLIQSKIVNNKFVKSCVKNGSSFVKSKGEIICIYLETNDRVIIDDFIDNDDNKSLCKYFGR